MKKVNSDYEDSLALSVNHCFFTLVKYLFWLFCKVTNSRRHKTVNDKNEELTDVICRRVAVLVKPFAWIDTVHALNVGFIVDYHVG